MTGDLMKIGIVCNRYEHFVSKFEAFKKHYDVRPFRSSKTNINIGRYQNFLYKRDLKRLMRWSDVAFFEFANKPLAVASHMKKVSKIIARLHRYELFSWVDQIDWEIVDKLILVSSAMQKRFVNKFPYMKEKTTVIYNDIDTETFAPINTKINKTIGIAGRIIPRKRVYELILTFYELQKQIPDLKLRICGSGNAYDNEYYVMTKELVTKLNLRDNVFFDGYFETVDKLVNWYNQIDILICNSLHESFHLTSHEAMACGRYALSHFWDGEEEFFDDDQIYKTGSELMMKIKSYYDLDKKSRQELSERIRQEIIDKYDSKKQIPKFIDLINEVYKE